MRLQGTSIYASIKLGDNKVVPKDVQVLRVGKFNHPQYGAFEITRATLAEMKANQDNKVRGIDMAFDYFHDSDKEAAGWVDGLELREGGDELWANVCWTPTAERKLAERELRYFSPDFAFNWKDPETGTSFNNVLFGGGLTNRPFVKEMKAIVASENIKGNNDMTDLEKAQKEVSDLKAANLKLSEDNKGMEAKLAAVPPAAPPAGADDVAALKKQISDLQAENAKLKSDGEAMLAEKVKADAAKCLAEKEVAFNVLLSEGKACVAQKDSFVKGDMTEFIKLAQPLNMKAAGSGASVTGDADADTIIKLAEEKRKANPKLSQGDAISMAKKELKK